MTAETYELIIAEIAGTPNLPGASCKGHADVFDQAMGTSKPAQREARRICRTCPAKPRCAKWLASLPAQARPVGVVAGRLVKPAPIHPNKAHRR